MKNTTINSKAINLKVSSINSIIMKKNKLLLFFLLLGSLTYAQVGTNLLPVEDWTEGNGSVSIFNQNGLDIENVRALGENPHNESSIIWTGVASGDYDEDGGWYADFPIDHAKTYRFTCWMKRNNSEEGWSFLGANNTGGSTLNLNGSVNTNPYFWSGDLPTVDKWYLVVGYVHSSNYTGTKSYGGVYDGETGEKVLSATDYKNSPTATHQRHRAYFFYCANAGDTRDFWGPRVEAVDGNEPSIQSLLSIEDKKTTGNLLKSDRWGVGTGNTEGFFIVGDESENVRSLDLNPHNESTIIWKGVASGNGNFDGGWNTFNEIDSKKSYRMSVWLKQNSTQNSTANFGPMPFFSNDLDGTVNFDPIFWQGNLPEADKWYLLVGYVHGHEHTGMVSYGGIYDKQTGEKIISMTDFKNGSNSTHQSHYVKHFGTAAGDEQDMWGARLEPIDGNEPTIQSLLGLDPGGIPKTTGNLLPVEDWNIGQGNVSVFTDNGPVEANTRALGINPFGEPTIIWAGTNESTDGDGGWDASFPVDHTKTYRVSTWVKRLHSQDDGTTYLGAADYTNSTLKLDGTNEDNPYFWWGDLPELDKWYLMVGYIHGSGYTETTSLGGLYDGETGEKVIDFTDFKNSTTAIEQENRSYLFYCTDPNTKQEFWGPRADLIDGNEPSVATMLGLGGAGLWSEITDGAVFNNGSVGIGVDENDMDPSYKLLVDGDIKTKKVKVTLDGWADYVFDENYKLPPLSEVEKYINEFGHLPEVPSEETVLREGIYLGQTDALLLKKIEELTLYVIQLEKDLKLLKKDKE